MCACLNIDLFKPVCEEHPFIRGLATERLRQDAEKRRNKAWFGGGLQS